MGNLILKLVDLVVVDKPFIIDEVNAAIYPGVGEIRDLDVADHVLAHTTIFDRLFNHRKMIAAGFLSQSMKMGVIEEPKGRWKY